jgi:hypothetical protein
MTFRYPWEEIYNAAIVETDQSKLQKLVQASKSAIDHRLQELQQDHGGTPEERRAISDALVALNVLRRELEKRSDEGRTRTA